MVIMYAMLNTCIHQGIWATFRCRMLVAAITWRSKNPSERDINEFIEDLPSYQFLEVEFNTIRKLATQANLLSAIDELPVAAAVSKLLRIRFPLRGVKRGVGHLDNFLAPHISVGFTPIVTNLSETAKFGAQS